MSLIAHYPLNGNTNDYSGNGYHATNGSATINNSGKIGKCYTFNATSINAGTNDNLNNVFRGRNFSISAWVRFTDTSGSDRGIINIGTGSTDTLLHIVRRGTVLYMGFYGDDMQSSTGISNDTWYHVVFNWNSNTKVRNIYINSNLDTTGVSTGFLNVTTGSSLLIGSAHVGDLNDVRIYDHVLSIKEIREISKAKILHYTFNDFQEPTTNLVNVGLEGMSGITLNYIGLESGWKKYGINGTWASGTYPYSMYITQNEFIGGISYSSQVLIKTNVLQKFEYFATGMNYVNQPMNNNGSGFSTVLNDGSIYVGRSGFVYTSTTTQTGYLSTKPLNNGTTFSNTTDFVYIKNGQIEKKSYTTPFVDGVRTGIIRDISGFRNDCTLTEATTPQWTNDTKLGSGSYKFTGTSSGVLDYLTIGNFGSMAGLTNSTISFWRKNAPTIGSWLPFCGQDGSYYIMATYLGTGTFYHNNIGSFWTIYNDGISQGQSSTPFTDQLWHNYVITGVNLSTWTTLKLSGYTNEWNCEGYFDDVRIYTTSLSSTDILELYKTRAQLDNTGNLFLNELVILPKSAYDIKMRYPDAESGIYTVYPTGDVNSPVSIYCDMDTEGGPWTLLVTTTTNSWTTTTVLDKNSTSPSITSDYSILKYADLFKTNLNGKLNYRMDAGSFGVNTFGRWGGIWEAPYTNTLLAKSALSQSLSTNLVKWDNWTIDTTLNDTSSPTNQIPWLGSAPTLLTTFGGAGSWWGTLVATAYSPAPWMASENQNPGIIWYWVK